MINDLNVTVGARNRKALLSVFIKNYNKDWEWIDYLESIVVDNPPEGVNVTDNLRSEVKNYLKDFAEAGDFKDRSKRRSIFIFLFSNETDPGIRKNVMHA